MKTSVKSHPGVSSLKAQDCIYIFRMTLCRNLDTEWVVEEASNGHCPQA